MKNIQNDDFERTTQIDSQSPLKLKLLHRRNSKFNSTDNFMSPQTSAQQSKMTKTFSQDEKTLKKQMQIQTWDGMFGNFLGFFRQKQLKSPPESLLKSLVKKDIKTDDPAISYTPLENVNQFQVNKSLKRFFSEYLNGKLDMNEMVKKSNVSVEQIQQYIRNKQYLARLKEQALRNQGEGEKPRFKFLYLLGIDESQMVKKIKIQKKYDLIRKLILKNQTIKKVPKKKKNSLDYFLFRIFKLKIH